MNIEQIHSAYFVGVGGIGMSAIARYFNMRNIHVSGYDKTRTSLTDQLENEGIQIHFEDNINLIDQKVITPDNKKNTLIIYTPAIPENHAELNYFKSNGYKLMKRSEVLGLITESTYTIAVAGTHGKTTTSCMITHFLTESGYACNAFLGGIASNYNSNVVFSSDSKTTIVEADEYDRSFLTLSPNISVVTSMDADHLDIYGEHDELAKGFQLFVDKLNSDGVLINRYGLNLTSSATTFTYGVGDSGDCRADNIRVENGEYVFDIVIKEDRLVDLKIGLPGLHNIENALAAVLVVKELGLSNEEIRHALISFQGVKRRFEYQIKKSNLVFIDDYAHHPEELKACINSVKQLYPNRKITGVFQPHLYSRTRDFADEFARSLELLNDVILLDIYPAREKPIKGVDSEMLLSKIQVTQKMLCSKEELVENLKKRELEVLLTLGAGDIDKLVEPIKNELLN